MKKCAMLSFRASTVKDTSLYRPSTSQKKSDGLMMFRATNCRVCTSFPDIGACEGYCPTSLRHLTVVSFVESRRFASVLLRGSGAIAKNRVCLLS